MLPLLPIPRYPSKPMVLFPKPKKKVAEGFKEILEKAMKEGKSIG